MRANKPYLKEDGTPFDEFELSAHIQDFGRKNPGEGVSGERFAKYLLNQGHDVIPYVNQFEAPGSVSYLVLKPENLRSRFAQFDPTKTDSPYIMKKEGGAVDNDKLIRKALITARQQVTAPNKTAIGGQRHMLAYITPYEAELLMRRGGSGRMTQYGVPAFDDGDGGNDGGNDSNASQDTAMSDPNTQTATSGNEGSGAGPTGAGAGAIGQDSQDDVGGPPGPPGGPNSGFGSSMTQDPEATQAAANMATAVAAQQAGRGVGIADTGGAQPTGFGAAPGIGEAMEAYEQGIIGLAPALGYSALSAFSPPGMQVGTVTDEIGNQTPGANVNIGGMLGGIAGAATGVPGAGIAGGMIGSAIADEFGVPTHTFSFADGGAATGGRMDPRMLPGIHVRVPHERVGRADGGPVQQPQDEDVRIDDPIIGYHGTPHEFDRFDPSKIGTGEGAQAFGHGMYFAE
ncbi:hypothetical protein EBT31_19235, partial [bacterium]|nr:hypothetical protein [bacterium]